MWPNGLEDMGDGGVPNTNVGGPVTTTPDSGSPTEGNNKLSEDQWKKTVSVPIDGEMTDISVEKAIRNYQKHLGADKRFQEASEAIKIVNQMKKGVQQADMAAMKTGLMGLGLTEEQANVALFGSQSDDASAALDDFGGDAGNDGSDNSELMSVITNLQQQVDSLKNEHQQERQTQQQNQVKQQVDGAIDSDPILAKMLGVMDSSEEDFFRRAIYASVATVSEQSPSWNSDVVQKGLRLFKQRQQKAFSAFNKGNSTGSQPSPTGDAGTGSAAANLLYSEATDQGSKPEDKPLEPVKMSDPKFGGYVKGLIGRSLRRQAQP